MVARPPQTQADLFSETPQEMPPPAKKPSPKAKPTCTQCMETYCTVQDVANRYKIFRTTVWRRVENNPLFPKPVKLTPGTTRWALSDLLRFEQAQKAKSNAAQHKKEGS